MALVILDIPGVTGESQIEGFKDKIICDTFGQDCELEIEPTQNARRTIHVPKINNLTLERKYDRASSSILKKMLTGKVDATPWKIHCLKGLGDDAAMQKEFLVIELEKPILTKHTLSINEGDTTESFEINAVKITWLYTQHDDTQTGKGQVPLSFDTLAGKVV